MCTLDLLPSHRNFKENKKMKTCADSHICTYKIKELIYNKNLRVIKFA